MRPSLGRPRLLVLLAAGVAAGALSGLASSGASFSNASVEHGGAMRAATDWVAPTIGGSALAPAAGGPATTYVRPGFAYRVYATASDQVSGVTSLTANLSALSTGAGSAALTPGSFSVGGTPFGYATATLTVRADAPDGPAALTLRAVDAAGNVRVGPGPGVTVDGSGPAVVQVDPGSPVRGTVALSATASDAGAGVATVTIQASPAGQGQWFDVCAMTTAPYTCSVDSRSYPYGLFDLRAVAVDRLGNSTTSATVANRLLDNVSPGVTLADPGDLVHGTVVLSAGAQAGAHSISSVRFQRAPAGSSTWTTICTDTGSPYTCSWSTTGGGDGLYDLRAQVTDSSGLTATDEVDGVRVDNTAPSSATLVGPGSPLRGTVTLSGAGADAGSGVAALTFQVAPGSSSSWSTACVAVPPATSCAFDTSVVPDGLYQVRQVTSDAAGNTRASTAVTARRIDNTAPTLTLADPGAALRGSVTLSATASDAGSGVASVRYQRAPAGSGAWTDVCTAASAPWSCAWATGAVADGGYDLRAIAVDAAGNTATSNVRAGRQVDNAAPTGVTLTDPGTPLRGALTLTATATDAGSGIASVRVQRAPAGTGTWTDACVASGAARSCSLDTATLADGSYDLRALAVDTAGNSTASATVAGRRVDNTAPAVGLDDPGAYLRAGVTLRATASDGGSGLTRVTIQRAPAGTGAWTDVCTATAAPLSCPLSTTTLADGGWDLRAVALDAAGNTAIAAATGRVVDNTAPAVALDPVPATLSAATTLTATASDAGSGLAGVTFQRSPAGAGDWTDVCADEAAPWSCALSVAALASGDYDLRAVAVDRAGNTTTSSTRTTHVAVDATRPGAAGVMAINTSGGDSGRAEHGDSLVFTFSEAMDPDSIKDGWSGSATPVTLRFGHGFPTDAITVYDGANDDPLALGVVLLGTDDALNDDARFSGTMTMSGATVTIVLGTPSSNWAFADENDPVRLTWIPSTLARDAAGNPMLPTLWVAPPPGSKPF